MDTNNAPYPPAPYSYQQQTSDHVPYPQVNNGDFNNRPWGTPVMGAPANPSSHPDNQQAATAGFQGSNSSVFRQPSGSFEAKQGQSQSAPTTSGTVPVGQAPQSPYVQASNPNPGQKGTMDKIVEQVNQFGKKVEVVATNVWSHWNSVADAAWGRLSAGTKVLTEGGFEKVFKSTFPVDADEVLKKTYACYLSTSTGPVAGTLYVSSKKFAFCSDMPLSYTPGPGQQQSYSYYKVVVPLERVRDVNPSVNQNKPAEKYIQVNTSDNYEFWFMGFVNYDKGVANMQAAARDRGSTPSTQTAGQNQVYPPPPAYSGH